ncbi:hypothetical protein [Azospirillum sp. sgz302134]
MSVTVPPLAGSASPYWLSPMEKKGMLMVVFGFPDTSLRTKPFELPRPKLYSSVMIDPVAAAPVMVAFVAWESVTANLSLGSTVLSPAMPMEKICEVSPG